MYKKEGIKIPIVERIKLQFVFSYLNLCNLLLFFQEKILYSSNSNPRKILVFRTGSMGDNLCSIPSLVAIRRHFPEAKIDILANAGASNLVSLQQMLDPSAYDRIIDYLGMPRRPLLSMLRKEKYDLIIQLPQTGSSFFRLLRDMFFFRLVSRAGFGWRISSVFFFRKTQEKFIDFDNETIRLKKFLENWDIDVNSNEFSLRLDPDDFRMVEDRYAPIALKGKESIAIIPGAKRPQNRWPAERFNQIIRHFRDKYNIILIGGPEDKIITDELESGSGIFDFCGLLTPMQSAWMLKKCVLAISNDTGPMHLAYAVGTPVIALFSSRDFPGKWFPPASSFNRVMRTPEVACSLCLSENCQNNICMKAIEPRRVIDSAWEILEKNHLSL